MSSFIAIIEVMAYNTGMFTKRSVDVSRDVTFRPNMFVILFYLITFFLQLIHNRLRVEIDRPLYNWYVGNACGRVK